MNSWLLRTLSEFLSHRWENRLKSKHKKKFLVTKRCLHTVKKKIKDKIIEMADYDKVVQSTNVDTDDESFKDKVMKKIVQPVQDYNKKKEQEPKKS